jgi:predicted RNase H-like nuclease (RuvC/YqgF family)
MSPFDAERDQISRAAEALLAGQVPGPLTVVRLAEAAGVKRWRLTHRHPDLMRDYQDRAVHINRENPEILKLRERLAAMDHENRELRARLRDLDDLVARYAQVINEFAQEREQLRLQPPGDVIQLRPT